MKEFVNELESVKKMIDNQEYKEANKKIEEMQNKILSSKDVGQYMDDLVGNLKQYFMVFCSILQKNVELCRLDKSRAVTHNNYSITQLLYFT